MLQFPISPTHITYIGHATLLIEMEGVRLLTDPILRNRVTFLRRRDKDPIDREQYHNVDAVLISHLHRDHLDMPSLRLLGYDMRIIAPHGAGSFLRRQGFRKVEEVRRGDHVRVRGLRIVATHADHSPARQPFGLRADCLGYMIQGRYQIYFPGDTDIFPEMAKLVPSLDLALLPVWGWGPTLGAGHMTPLRAAEALNLLRPRMAVPIHWGALHPAGMGWLKPSFLTVPPQHFAYHAARIAPEVEVEILPPGDSMRLDEKLQ